MASTVRVSGLERIQPYLDKLTNGYTRKDRLHLQIIGDSWVNGVGTSVPDVRGFAAILVAGLKGLAGDGGTFLTAYFARQIWNSEPAYGYFASGRRNTYWWDDRIIDGLMPYATKTWFGPGMANSWVANGGFGGWYQQSVYGQTPWTPSSQAYVLVHAAGYQYNLVDINGTSGGTEPAWGGAGSFTVDNDLKWQNIGTPVGGDVAWQANKAYKMGDIRKSTDGTKRLRVDAGKTGASAPAWPAGLDTIVTDGSAVWKNGGPAVKTVPLASGRRYRLIHKRDATNAIAKLDFLQPTPGYPFTVDAGATADEWGHASALPDTDTDAYRSLLVDRMAGTLTVEGIQTLAAKDVGLLDYIIGISGRSIRSVDEALSGNSLRQEAFVGKNFIPNSEPVLVVLELGINDFNGAMGAQTNLATAQAAIKRIIQYYTNVFTDAYFLYIQPPPFVAGGSPQPGDPQYDYMSGLAAAAYNATTAGGAQARVCVMDCSQAFGGLTASGSRTAGFLVGDTLHLSDTGHSYLARGILDGLQLPGRETARGNLLTDDREWLTAQFAAVKEQVSAVDGQKVDEIHDSLFGALTEPLSGIGKRELTLSDGTKRAWDMQSDGVTRKRQPK